MSRKNLILKAKRRKRKSRRTPDQRAKDGKLWACGRKVPYSTEQEAQAVADKLQHRAYQCSYGPHFHTAHLPGSQRFVRARA